MTALPRSFNHLLRVLHLLTDLSRALLALAVLILGGVLLGLFATPLGLSLSTLLLWTLTALAGLGHLRVALVTARQSGPFHGEVGERLRAAGLRLMYAAALLWAGLGLLLGAARDSIPAELWTELLAPAHLLSCVTTLALPLLLLVLADWLDEGRTLAQRAQAVV